MIIAFDRFFASAEVGIAVVPAENSVTTAVAALASDAKPVPEIGVLFGSVYVAQTGDAEVDGSEKAWTDIQVE